MTSGKYVIAEESGKCHETPQDSYKVLYPADQNKELHTPTDRTTTNNTTMHLGRTDGRLSRPTTQPNRNRLT